MLSTELKKLRLPLLIIVLWIMPTLARANLSGFILLPDVPDIAYSLGEDSWVYFYSGHVPVDTYNITEGRWEDPYTFRVIGWVYIDWPFYYIFDSGYLMYVLPPEPGLWVYHFRTGQWTLLPRILP